jgi:hypothetical protein
MTIYKCIKGFTDYENDKARLGQEFIIGSFPTASGDLILQRKSGRGSTIHITKEQFDKHFQEVISVAKKELKNEFKVGDSVMIAKSSEYYHKNDFNPADTKGRVTKSHKQSGMGFCYEVKWSNGRSNSYGIDDLIAYDEPKKELSTSTKKEWPVWEEKVVDDRLAVGNCVEITIDRPESSGFRKGEVVVIIGHEGRNNYCLESPESGGWYVSKEFTKPVTNLFPNGTKVRVKIDNPNYSGLNKGDIVTIEGIYNATRPSYVVKRKGDYDNWCVSHAYLEVVEDRLPIGIKVEILIDYPDSAYLKKGDITTIIENFGGSYGYLVTGGWSINKDQCKEYVRPKYYRFTEEFYQYIQNNSPLLMGRGLVAEEDKYECLIVAPFYTPVIEEKNGLKLIRLIKD